MTMKEFTEVELKFEAQVRSMYDRLLVKLSIERIFYVEDIRLCNYYDYQ